MTETNIVDAVIFDSDGTLVNTTDLIVDGYVENLRRNGYEDLANREYIVEHIGGTVAHTFARMIGQPEHSPRVASMVVQQDEIQDELAKTSIKPYPNVVATLEELKRRGIKVGMFTSVPS